MGRLIAGLMAGSVLSCGAQPGIECGGAGDCFAGEACVAGTCHRVPAAPPRTPKPVVSPDPPLANAMLECVVDAVPDGLTIAFAWFQDGEVTDVSTQTVPSERVLPCSRWRCQAAASDGNEAGVPQLSQEVEVPCVD